MKIGTVLRCGVRVGLMASAVPVLADFRKAPEPKDVPPLLMTAAGKIVNSVEDWEKVRRPEIARTFATEVYGVRPVERPADLRFETLRTESACGGKAVRED